MDADGASVTTELIVGAGLRGLLAALSATGSDEVLLLESAERAGGSVRSPSLDGFLCELGPFAFALEEITPLLQQLDAAPPLLVSECESGMLFDGATLRECPVAPPPVAFAGGCDEFVRAAQEQLGPHLRPSTTARGIVPEGAGFRVEVADESVGPMLADGITLATPIDQTATLLAGFDPALFDLVERLERTPRAFVFFGAAAADCAALQGYGIVPTETVDSPLVEAIHCSRVFPNRCPPDAFLVRCELAGMAPDTDEAALGSMALDELAAWTDWRAEPTFTHVHRFTTIDQDAAWVEARTRIQALAARFGGLTIA